VKKHVFECCIELTVVFLSKNRGTVTFLNLLSWMNTIFYDIFLANTIYILNKYRVWVFDLVDNRICNALLFNLY
jgi:hypothetical protein